MELDEYVAMMFSNDTSAHVGILKIKDFTINIHGEIKADAKGIPVLMNNISINKTNVGVAATYLVDLSKDTIDEVINDIETLVSFLFFGVDKVAKAIPTPPQ